MGAELQGETSYKMRSTRREEEEGTKRHARSESWEVHDGLRVARDHLFGGPPPPEDAGRCEGKGVNYTSER